MRTITNKVYDELAKELENYLQEELGVNIDVSQNVEIMIIILNILGIKKE